MSDVPGPTRDVDILIVGGGMLGIPLAVALSRRGWSVAVLERSPASEALPEPLASRCSALSAGSRLILERWGLWEAVAADAEPIHEVHVSQQGYAGSTRLRASDEGVPALGYVVSNDRLAADALSTLQDAAADVSPPALLYDAELLGIDDQSERLVATVRQGGAPRQIACRLLLAVDGIGSRVRELTGIGTRQVDYRQSAVVTNVQLDRPHDQRAFERFVADGPMAVLPRPHGIASIVCCIDPQQQAEWQALQGVALATALQQRFGTRAGRFLDAGPAVTVPLVRIESLRQTAPRTVVLGNAMRLLHPVAGQGYNLALRDADTLLRLLDGEHALPITAMRAGPVADPGDAALLDALVAQRRDDQASTVRLTDSLARAFRGQSPLAGHVRGALLGGLDLITPLRHAFAHRSMGLGG